MDSTITYRQCADVLLKLWIDDILTDSQYYKIIDKLNEQHKKELEQATEPIEN